MTEVRSQMSAAYALTSYDAPGKSEDRALRGKTLIVIRYQLIVKKQRA